MRILWLKTELLHPVDKGGKIRTYHMLKELKKKHHVTYLTLEDGSAEVDAEDKSREYAHETITVSHKTSPKFSPRFYAELVGNLVSNYPYALQKYVSPEMSVAIKRQVDGSETDIAVCDFLAPAVNFPLDLKVPTLLFQHNVEAIIWRRHFENETNPLKKAFLKTQWRRMFEYEKKTCLRFDRVVAVSQDDAEIIQNDYGAVNVSPISTGVDTEYFAPTGEIEKDEFNIVFTGSMDWLPNEDAIQWFISDVLPLIRMHIPNVSLTVVGRNPFRSLVELSRKDQSIIVTGRVQDVRPYMEKSSVYIVPIRIGGGTRLKIYEAMAMELPIVSTTIGAEGLPVKDGKEILLSNDPVGFASAVVRVLQDKDLAVNLGRQAAKSVREKHGWANVADDFASNCERAIGESRQAPRDIQLDTKLLTAV